MTRSEKPLNNMVKSKTVTEVVEPTASTSAIAMDVDAPTPEVTTAEPVKKDKSKKRKRAVEAEVAEEELGSSADALKATEEISAESSNKAGKGAVLPDELEIDLKAPTPLSKAEARQAKRDAKKAKKEGKEGKEDGTTDGEAANDATATDAEASTSEPPAKRPKKAKKDAGDPDDPPKPKRANSIWIGNLNFRSTADGLREWITKMIVQGSTGVGDIPADASLVKALGKIKGGADKAITRVNLPTKPGKGRGMIPEGKGFAYVDFASKELQTFAVGLSERVFGGRKVLIKLGDDHAPTPDARTPKPLSIIAGTLPPASKLGANPPSSSLFCGNLAFDTNEVELREHVEREVARARGMNVLEDGEEEEEGDDESEDGDETGSGAEEDKSSADEEEEENTDPAAEPESTSNQAEDEPSTTVQDILHGDQKGKDTKTTSKISGLKKVRMPLFEDSGRCKGFAFLDFESPEFATFALAQRPLMFFKGRKLVLQYASEEATKRSLPAHKRNADKEKEASFGNTPSRGGFSSRGGGRGFSSGERKPYQSGDAAEADAGGETGESNFMKRPERKPRVDRPAFGAPGGAIGDDADGRGAARGKKWEASGRPRPGAALAMAKRQNVSIVAGQGKKVTFD